MAASNGLRTRAPTPSPRTIPLALLSKGLHWPSGESICVFAAITAYSGVLRIKTPPAKAISDSPLRRLSQARWMDTREEELAVSMVKLGPLQFKKYETLPARMAISVPKK